MERLKPILAILFVSATVLMAGCGSSEDGPQLSDEEKIQKASAGRAAQMNAQGGSPTGNAPAPAAGGN